MLNFKTVLCHFILRFIFSVIFYLFEDIILKIFSSNFLELHSAKRHLSIVLGVVSFWSNGIIDILWAI